jgi:alpha-galactosidase
MRTHHRIHIGIAMALTALFVACTGSPSVPAPTLEQEVPSAYVGADQSWTAPLDQDANAVISTQSIEVNVSGFGPLPYGLHSYTPDVAQNGWGPYEINISNGESKANDGRGMTMNGTAHDNGLGVHAPSLLEYPVAKQCSEFQATVGLDDEIDTQTKYGSVVFQVFGDGKKIYDSGIMRGNTPSKKILVDIKGVQRLKLVVTDAGDGKFFDHADWAEAMIACPTINYLRGGAVKPGINYLSDLSPYRFYVSNGYGPIELDMSNGEQFAQDGRQISLNGQRYARGLGVHAPSTLQYVPNGKCTRFKADIGLDDEVDNAASAPVVEFTFGASVPKAGMSGDGVSYRSGPMTRNDKKSIDIDITGYYFILLQVLPLNTENNPKANWYAHADWANAQLICN